MFSKVTQLYTHSYIFFLRFFSLIGYYKILIVSPRSHILKVNSGEITLIMYFINPIYPYGYHFNMKSISKVTNRKFYILSFVLSFEIWDANLTHSMSQFGLDP